MPDGGVDDADVEGRALKLGRMSQVIGAAGGAGGDICNVPVNHKADEQTTTNNNIIICVSHRLFGDVTFCCNRPLHITTMVHNGF